MKRFVFAACTAFVVGTAGVAEDVPKPPSSAVQIAGIDIQQLAETFATNEVRADALHVGRQITVTGAVARVATPRHPPREEGKDAYFVELKTEGTWPSDVRIQFFFNQGERPRLVDLRAGQEIAIQGRCERPAIYTGERGKKDYLEIPVRDCSLLKTK